MKYANLAVMIFYIILSVVTALVGTGAVFVGLNLNYLTDQIWKEQTAGSDNVSGGFGAIAHLFGGGLSILIAMAMFLLGLMMLVMFGLCISMVVSGIRCNRVFQVPGSLNLRKIRNSSIYKLVINSLFLFGGIILCMREPSVFVGLCITVFLVFEVLVIIMLVKLSSYAASGVI